MLASSAIQQLKSHFRGELIVPSDLGYDGARKVFNVSIDRRPALIARCISADDVIQAVNLARQENLLVSIRGTGHNVAGFAVCDGGLMPGVFLREDPHQARIFRNVFSVREEHLPHKRRAGLDCFACFWVNFLTPPVWARDTSPPKSQS